MADIQAVSLFLQFVPLEGELLDFFQPLTSQILNLLRGTSCLPTDPLHTSEEEETTPTFTSLVTPTSTTCVEEEGEELRWKQPSQVLYVRDDFIREHISQRILEKALNLSYLHSAMLPYVNFSLQRQLHVQSMNIEHLKEVAGLAMRCYEQRDKEGVAPGGVECGGDSDSVVDMFDRIKVDPREVFVRWIANWLACVHVVMEEGGSGGHSLMADKLKDLHILPLEDGRFVTASQQSGIFFPPDYRGKEHLVMCMHVRLCCIGIRSGHSPLYPVDCP